MNWLGYDPTIWLLIGATLAPLMGFVVLVFLGRKMGKAAGWFGTAAIATAAVLALSAAWRWVGYGEGAHVEPLLIPWLNVTPTIVLKVGVHVDGLTIAMCSMVTVVATMIHLFSIGYMAGDSRYSRFFAYLNLFCFSMLGLVLGNTLVSLFIFWELVGLCSYLLIGFWFEKKSASNAAIKAFVVNRVGDFGFVLGLAGALLWLAPEWAKATGWVNAHPGATLDLTIAQMNEMGRYFINQPGGPPGWLTAIGLLLFCGAIGKSAQFPLHVWLPDAMEGPTPVSALIHAATMVAAGVYMVGRIFGLLTPDALLVIASVGLVTLTLAALIAITQTDIKRVLAYSTVSQLGYMVMAIGLGGYISGLFHLITHAFFKALLFLGSGAVIYACHHEQDIRKMGGLWRAIPTTCITFLIATLAIAGVTGTSGYYSKHLILANAYDYVQGHTPESTGEGHDAPTAHEAAPAGHAVVSETAAQALAFKLTTGAGKPFAVIFYYLPMAIAFVTSFYMFRVWWLTFFGKPRDEHVFEHALHHGVPWVMNVPLIVLAAGAILTGYEFMQFVPWIRSTRPPGTWESPTAHAVHAIHYVGYAVWVAGFGLAWLIYRKGFAVAEKTRRPIEPLYRLVYNKFYFDELYNAVFVRGTLLLCALSRVWDNRVIDGLVNSWGWATKAMARLSGWFDNRAIDGAANGLALATLRAGTLARAPQTGRVRNYVLFMVGGTAVALGAALVVRVIWS
jgi:NADH-quinone oxidoreductase subunit L